MEKKIIVRGARVHNLKNIDIEIPRNKMVVITGISGSGKSSLAFDTIYAEGQRKYVESLSAYARQFLQTCEKPDVDSIEGLSPAISIDQKTVSKNPRSTVGTVTEIYDYLRLLYARTGTPYCPKCGKKISSQSPSQITEKIAKMSPEKRIMLLAPIVNGRKGEHKNEFEKIRKEGFVRFRFDGTVYSIAEELDIDPNKTHNLEIVVDRLITGDFEPKITKLGKGEVIEEVNPNRTRLSDSIETALKFGEGNMVVVDADTGEESIYSEKFACPDCDISLGEIEPRTFSFNSPHGACPSCHGLGIKLEIDPDLIIPNKNLTLSEGALVPWSSSNSSLGWFNRLTKSVGEKYGFDLNKPIKKFNKKQLDILLYGAGDEEFEMDFDSAKLSGKFKTKFEGAIPALMRRYKDTEVDHIKKKVENFMVSIKCPECKGKKLRIEALSVKINDKNIIETTEMSIEKLIKFFEKISFSESQKIIAKPILKEIISRMSFLYEVGVPYLTLNRSANTLSGGEAQRIRLATQIGSKLSGVLYVLDEPSIGLHQKDNGKLIKTLISLKNLENSVLVVEHDEEIIRKSDYIVDVGPGAGRHGGLIVAQGTPKEIEENKDSLTGDYISGRKKIEIPESRRKGNGKFLEVIEARENNLKIDSVKFPLGTFTCVTGVSGSGKSSLVNKILVNSLETKLNRAKRIPGKHKNILGVENLDKIIAIDQSPIGRTPRSNPATYTGVFTDIRDLFAKTAEARMRGYKAGRFSFNVKGGRCESCKGDGIIRVEMHFLPDIYVPCEECSGKRYNSQTLEITYRGKNISDALEMTVSEALDFFDKIPSIKRKLKTLQKVGLGYIKLGQSATTLSGGEAQRIKLSTELSKRSTGKTIYVLDEPTTGLHFDDVKKLLKVLQKFVEKGNTVLVIEHNLDIIKCADYLIDIGPEGGDHGGKIVADGTPEEVSKNENSFTGKYLKEIL